MGSPLLKPAQVQKTYQDLGGGLHGLLVLGHDADVEDSREDEDQAGGRCCTWRTLGRSGCGQAFLQSHFTWSPVLCWALALEQSPPPDLI